MNKVIYIFVFCFGYIGSQAQDTARKRTNISVSYSVGVQSFGLNGLENSIRAILERNMPTQGRTSDISFPTTIVNRVSIGASIFKNKNWFLHLDGVWGSNSLTATGYSTDANGNPFTANGKADFSFIYTGHSISREFDLGKWGKISPYIGFYLYWKTVFKLDVQNEVRDKSTNEIIQSGKGVGFSASPYRRGSPYIFWLFDNPKLGLNYDIKLLDHTYLSLNYSYWWANAYANEVYSLSNSYIVEVSNRSLTKKDPFHKDLYSHNISVGLTFKLLN